MNRFDNMSKDAMARVEEIMNSTKLNEFLHRKEEEEKKKTCILWVLAIIGVVAAVAAIAYGVYRFFTPDYLEDFEDDNQNQACLADRDTPFLFHRKLYPMKLHKKYHLGDRT